MKRRAPFVLTASTLVVVCCCLTVFSSLSNSTNSKTATPETEPGNTRPATLAPTKTRNRIVTTTPRPVATQFSQTTIKVNQANIRSGPGSNYPIIATLNEDTTLQAIADDGNAQWYNVVWPDGTGWVWFENIDVTGLNNLAVAVTIPPLPAGASLNASTRQPTAAAFPPTAPPPVCDCSGDAYNCGSFGSQRAAQSCFNYCMPISGDIHRLDGDGDGRVCE